MISRIGRIVATVVALISGLFILIDIIISQSGTETSGLIFNPISFILISWITIILAFTLILGLINVAGVHYNRIRAKKPGRIYSVVLLLSLVITLLVGFVSGGLSSGGNQFIFRFILQPLEATIFALLALFIASAAFRAFRVRDLETGLFVFFALVVLLGQVPASIYLWSDFPILKDWILNVPTLAGVRGILLGVAVGTIATGLRVLIGVDRPYTD